MCRLRVYPFISARKLAFLPSPIAIWLPSASVHSIPRPFHMIETDVLFQESIGRDIADTRHATNRCVSSAYGRFRGS